MPRRVTIMGLGHFGGGAAVARWLARAGDVVTVTDLADAERLRDALEALRGEPIAAYHLGAHRDDDFLQADLVVVNPAVRPDNPWLRMAQQASVPITSEIELFLNACRGRTVGVTGTNGKSTTAAMTAAALRACGVRAWLGGNIGESLLDKLDEIRPDDWVVLELSSFQLHRLSAQVRGLDAALVTNCTPNHLNWHPDFAHYAAAKKRILAGQRADGLAVLNLDDAEVRRWAPLVRGRLLPAWADDRIPPLRTPGAHNRANAALAAAAVEGLGGDEDSICDALQRFGGLPQRMELMAMVDGRRFINDSAATTPESAIAALQALDAPGWLLAGGSDKGADFAPLVAAIAARARGAALFGAVAAALAQRVRAAAPQLPCCVAATLDEALAWCWRQSQPGDAIVLSPGCASLDQYVNYRARGEHFRTLVDNLTRERSSGS